MALFTAQPPTTGPNTQRFSVMPANPRGSCCGPRENDVEPFTAPRRPGRGRCPGRWGHLEGQLEVAGGMMTQF